jgi:predicted DNA-binding transcriptional regulator AlpA
MTKPRTAEHSVESLLNERDVARITGLSVASLRRRRLLNQAPKYYKLGAAVKYKTEDIAAWIDSCATGGGRSRAGSPPIRRKLDGAVPRTPRPQS